MPMPGSQTTDSIGLAYLLYSWRWAFRLVFLAMIIAGIVSAFTGRRKWIPISLMVVTLAIVYLFNFEMTADHMFLQPQQVVFKSSHDNKVPGNRLVIGVAHNNEAKAYPIAFMAYHHQVIDTVGGKEMIITYCSVCRTGRVYEPVVNGKSEKFRLVGMDHFNAMFEDATTSSWWRQANGQAVTGKLKGNSLPEVASIQVTVDKWFELYPNGKVMQQDESFIISYDTLARFEQGKSKGSLTRTDSVSWKDKSWIIGIQSGEISRAYDWNDLKRNRIINDTLNGKGIFIVLSTDEKSFVAFERPGAIEFTVSNDTLISDSFVYDFSGKNLLDSTSNLRSVPAYQEFWHSWKTFHPQTGQYK